MNADLLIQAGALGLLAITLFWLFRKHMPNLVHTFKKETQQQRQDFREELSNQRAEFLASLKDQREFMARILKKNGF